MVDIKYSDYIETGGEFIDFYFYDITKIVPLKMGDKSH